MIEHQEIKRRSIRGVVSFVVRTLLLQGIAFVATVLLGYYLTPQDFGVYFIVVSTISVFTFLSDIGLAAALVQKHEDPTLEELRTTFTVQEGLACFIFLLVVVCTPLWKIHKGLDQQGLYLLYALAFSFVLASLKTIPSILLERKLEFGKIVLPQIIENVVFYGVAVYFAAQGKGVESYTLAVLLRGVAGAAMMYLIQPWNIGVGFSRKAFSHLKSFGLQFQVNDLLARLKDDLLVVVLGLWLPTYQMGLLSWAKRWSLFPYQLAVQSVLSVMFSTFSRLQKDKELMRRAIEKSLFFIALIIFPVLAGLCVMAFPLTEVIPKYQKWQPALPSLYLFCLNILFAAVANPLIHALNAMGKVEHTLKLMVAWTTLTWISTPVFIMLFGFNGVALASVLVAGSSLGTLYILRRYVEIRFFDQIWRQACATGIMIMSLIALWKHVHPSFISIGVLSFVGAFVYLGVLALLGFNRVLRELQTMKQAFQKSPSVYPMQTETLEEIVKVEEE